MMWGFGWGWPGMLWMGFGGLFWIVVVGLVIWALVRWLGERSTSDRQPPVGGPSALDLLQQRYARGEIDAVTFEQMRERLMGSPRGVETPHETREPTATKS